MKKTMILLCSLLIFSSCITPMGSALRFEKDLDPEAAYIVFYMDDYRAEEDQVELYLSLDYFDRVSTPIVMQRNKDYPETFPNADKNSVLYIRKMPAGRFAFESYALIRNSLAGPKKTRFYWLSPLKQEQMQLIDLQPGEILYLGYFSQDGYFLSPLQEEDTELEPVLNMVEEDMGVWYGGNSSHTLRYAFEDDGLNKEFYRELQ